MMRRLVDLSDDGCGMVFLPLGHLCHESVVFKVSLILVVLCLEVSLEGCDFCVGRLPRLGQNGCGIITYALEIGLECGSGVLELGLVGVVGLLDSFVCGHGLGIDVRGVN